MLGGIGAVILMSTQKRGGKAIGGFNHVLHGTSTTWNSTPYQRGSLMKQLETWGKTKGPGCAAGALC
jgi:hypothetical protein